MSAGSKYGELYLMNISGIRPSLGFYDYNSIRIRQELGMAPVDEPVEETPVEDSTSGISDEEIAASREAQTFGAYDFASQYKPGESFDLKGADSDIKSLDVEKAVSSMQKDSLIHRYQYFVQNKTPQEQQVKPAVEDFKL